MSEHHPAPGLPGAIGPHGVFGQIGSTGCKGQHGFCGEDGVMLPPDVVRDIEREVETTKPGVDLGFRLGLVGVGLLLLVLAGLGALQ